MRVKFDGSDEWKKFNTKEELASFVEGNLWHFDIVFNNTASVGFLLVEEGSTDIKEGKIEVESIPIARVSVGEDVSFFPCCADVVSDLEDFLSDMDSSVEEEDVRLCIESEGSWELRRGHVSFDLRHPKYCGAGVLTKGASTEDLYDLAEDMIDQCARAFWEEM